MERPTEGNSLQEYYVFARLNLLNTPYRMKGPFDLIFCRNVMIYFDNELRRRISNEMHRLLRETATFSWEAQKRW